MTKRWIIIGTGLAAYGAIVTYADPILLFIIVCFGLVLLAAPWAAVALARLLFVVVSKRGLRRAVLLLADALSVAGLMALAVPINGYIQERAVAAAKAFPDRVGPLLEEYRQQHGVYPASLDQLPSYPRIPRLLRRSYGYRSDGHSYTFTFPKPGGIIDLWYYSSEEHTWHLST